ncbi:MAG: HEAT repeat domain-containing protein [Planctomycetaceae bacterium]
MLIGAGICLGGNSLCLADHLVLTNGGVVRGLFEEEAEVTAEKSDTAPEQYEIRTLSGNLLTISAVEVEEVVYQPVLVEEYAVKAAATPDTAEAHWTLAEWCRQQELFPEWKSELETVLKLDPNYIAARQLLTKADIAVRKQQRDEEMRSLGMVKYRGKYITEREKEMLDKVAEERERREVWWKKVKLWHGWLTHRTASYRQKGIDALSGIDSPDALPALEKYLQQEDGENYRLLLAEILPNIDSDQAILKLIELSLFDNSPQVRNTAFNNLPADKLEFVTGQYVRQLNHSENLVVRRSAEILAQIGDVRVVPHLIDALITTHTYQVSVPIQNQTYAVGAPGPIVPPEIEYQLRTGQLPFGVVIDNTQTNNVQPPPQTKLVNVNRDIQNSEVLAALKTLTDQDFQFNEVQWRNWWNSVRDGKAPLPVNQTS